MYGALNSVPGAGDPKANKADGICALRKLTAEQAEGRVCIHQPAEADSITPAKIRR